MGQPVSVNESFEFWMWLILKILWELSLRL